MDVAAFDINIQPCSIETAFVAVCPVQVHDGSGWDEGPRQSSLVATVIAPFCGQHGA